MSPAKHELYFCQFPKLGWTLALKWLFMPLTHVIRNSSIYIGEKNMLTLPCERNCIQIIENGVYLEYTPPLPIFVQLHNWVLVSRRTFMDINYRGTRLTFLHIPRNCGLIHDPIWSKSRHLTYAAWRYVNRTRLQMIKRFPEGYVIL